jgi:hypothetical protein
MNQFPFKITPNATAAGSSPSVYLEKGRYRLRKSSTRSSGPTRIQAPYQRTSTSTSRCLILLLVLLVVASMSSFGLAYYLFTTRWGMPFFREVQTPADGLTQVIEYTHPPNQSGFDSDTKFLSYLPHSGFHNQRIALENALTLAHILNRTLVLPPIRLGSKPIRYQNFHTLRHVISHSGKEGLQHCANQFALDIALAPECLDFFDYTYLPWDWLVNISAFDDSIKTVSGWDLRSSSVIKTLDINSTNVFTLEDTSPYQYRFLDTLNGSLPSVGKYQEGLLISDLQTSNHDLIQIGTLFGSSRLKLQSDFNRDIRRNIRQNMQFSNAALNHASSSIANRLGTSYIGIHLRVGDGRFQGHGTENTRELWWTLMHDVFKFSPEIASAIEQNLVHCSTDCTVNKTATNSESNDCRDRLHYDTELQALNIPLYISTDVPNPRNHPLLHSFRRTFPCVFFLDDFPEETRPLDFIVNGYDMIHLKPFILPFVDAMVLGHASQIVTTRGSTFSSFARDVLWRRYHGLDIIERG